MYSDEELEPFQMNEGEFRRGRKRTKEDMIYGMWAEHDSDEESNRHKDYTRPVNFVGSSEINVEESGDEDSDENLDLDEEARRILEGLEQEKLERGGEKAGVGKFTKASLDKNKKLSMFHLNQNKEGGGVPDGDGSKGASGGDQPSTRKKTKPVSLKKQMSKVKSQPMDNEFGRWERYSSGFGSKMLEKMGWRHGSGLGNAGEGIVNPVKATSHKEFGKGLAHMQVKKSIVAVSDSEEEQEEEESEDEQQWKKGKAAGKPKYRYKTVDELKQESSKRPLTSDTSTGAASKGGGGEASMKVIDMTGPQKRVLSSYEQIHNRHARPDEASLTNVEKKLFLPELLHNMKMLVDNTESEIIRTDRRLHYNRDLVVNVEHELERGRSQHHDEDQQIEKLSEVLSAINLLEERLTSPGKAGLTVTECEEMMRDLQDKHPVEYRTYGLSSVAVAVVFPLIKSLISTWDMLGVPRSHMDMFGRWKSLLRETDSEHTMPSSENMDPYDRLVWEVWMPRLRSLVLGWSPRMCDPMVALLEAWSPLLPGWVLENILDQLILPRIQAEQESWDPTTDIMPVHKWIHPWLPLMETKLEVLYPSIRYKMASALANWHPSDKSAHKILEPWVPVFTPQVMESFVVRTILPKLAYCLQVELQINPHQQKIAPFEWVMAWKDMLGAHHYASMLEKSFFPKWVQVLSTWLANNPNFDEITKWYKGWKGMLDPTWMREPSVKFYLNQALDMMNRAVAGNFQPGARENMAYFVSTERRQQSATMQNALSAPASVSFKDIVEQAAASRGILFVPMAGQKHYEGKLLYTFGRATVFIDRGVTFVLRPTGQWNPVSIDELVRLA